MKKRKYKDYIEKDEEYACEMMRVADELGVSLEKLSRKAFSEHCSEPNMRTWAWRRGWGTCKAIALELAQQVEDDDSHPSIFDSYGEDDDDTAVDLVVPLAEPRPASIERYVVTWAQNATPINDDFFCSLLTYCRVTDAQLIVIPGRYRNPTSIWSANDAKDDWWDVRLHPFLRDEPIGLCRELVVHGETMIQPTAPRPLSSFEAYAQTSAIFGHPKIQLMTIPGHTAAGTRTFATTGAVTIQNYTPTKAGQKGHSHHVFGALVVEVYGSKFFMRHVNATQDGAFIDLDKHYDLDEATDAPPAAALVCGDLHAPLVDRSALASTWGQENSMLTRLRPEKLFLHDTLAFHARNHHRRSDPDHLYAVQQDLLGDSVQGELATVAGILKTIPDGPEVVAVASNHDEALDRWLKEAKIEQDPVNARIYHELRAEKLKRYDRDLTWTPALQIVLERFGITRIRCLRRDATYPVKGIELAFHGDQGIGGSRGSVLAYSKLATKTIVGHYHSPTILDGCYAVGMLGDFDQRYNLQPSTWDRANCVIYANGKRSLLFIRDGRWCLS